ncbi:MAG: anaerobic ribonucleoside-triphosphate reductase activating protein [Clostridia bacterium]|nr:anaerobic ribonucleoside-triphosphate reductase activating protein [Clostridia bacterium]
MQFSGFQKLTLLDYPEKTACTLFTAGCNFRCPFCHNAALVTHIDNENYFTEEYVLEYLKKRAGVLDGVCITGGEPLMHKELPDFIAKVKELGYKVKLDTNGSYPDRLATLIDGGLIDYVAMDIKNCREKYIETADCSPEYLQKIEQSIELLKQKKIDFEFRTTVVKEFHTVDDIKKIAEWINGADKYFLQNFIDSGDLIQKNLAAVNPETLELMRSFAQDTIPKVEKRGI